MWMRDLPLHPGDEASRYWRSSEFLVTVRILGGEEYTFPLYATDKVMDLMYMIQDETGIPVRSQQLMSESGVYTPWNGIEHFPPPENGDSYVLTLVRSDDIAERHPWWWA